MRKRAALTVAKGVFGRLTARRLRCSFCRRPADQVERLVAGASAYICDACIANSVEILKTNGGFEPTGAKH